MTQMTEALIRGFFDTVLAESADAGKAPSPCVLTDEAGFQKVLLGLHRYKLSVRDRVPVDILIHRNHHPSET
jgi:hypothetical protein